jgi:hypothetical protein
MQKILLALAFIVVIGGGAYLYFSKDKAATEEEQVYCTQEAMECPDGSYVGRQGPNCEFAACPGASDLKTYNDSATGASYKYADLSTKYISTVEWPPKVTVTNKPYTCVERTGVTSSQTINGHEYCVTKTVEGAAGSTYTDYVYAFGKDGKTVSLSFNLRSVQCGNYNDPEKTACEKERAAFNPDTLADQMATSFAF